MSDQERHSDDLKLIRKMMEESSRFLSLSGLSGVFIGLYAIVGALLIKFLIIGDTGTGMFSMIGSGNSPAETLGWLLGSLIILFLALGTAYLFALRESKSKNQKILGPVTRQLLINLFVPLLAGGILILVFFIKGHPEYIGATTLIFYGLALFNAGKYTFGEVQYLGLLEITAGLLAALLPEFALLFWIFGFGVLHILYGLVLHRKYR